MVENKANEEQKKNSSGTVYIESETVQNFV